MRHTLHSHVVDAIEYGVAELQRTPYTLRSAALRARKLSVARDVRECGAAFALLK